MRLPLAAMLAPLIALAVAPAVAQVQPGAPIASRIAAGTYKVDPAHTQVLWEVNHMGFSQLSGMFGASAGSITIDPAKPAATRVEVTFQIDQLSVTAPAFATHLKSDQIFDVAKYPTASFVSTGVVPHGTDKATITGNLTIRGITKPVTLEASFIGAGANPMNKKLNFGFSADGTVKRSDFGVGWPARGVPPAGGFHPPAGGGGGARRPAPLPAAAGLLLQRVDPLRRVGLGQVAVELLVSFLAQGLEVARLRSRHRLAAGGPVVGILFRVADRMVLGVGVVDHGDILSPAPTLAFLIRSMRRTAGRARRRRRGG